MLFSVLSQCKKRQSQTTRTPAAISRSQPRPIRELTIALEINRRHGDEDRAADAEGKRALRAKVTQDIYAQRCQQARAVAEQALIAQLGTHVTGPLPKQLVAGH